MGSLRFSNTRDFFSAPVRITLSNGVSFMATNLNGTTGTGTDTQPIAMPAAERIEQLKATGGASLIQDNKAAIVKALAKAYGEE